MNRRAKIRWISYLAAAFAVLLAALAACHVGAGGYTTRIDAQSTRAFGEALSAVERLDRSLQKCPFAADAAMESAICAQVYGDAQSAETALSALPVELDALESISRHIAVVGDYAFSLSRAAAAGETFTEKNLEQLAAFSETTRGLYEQLSRLRESFRDGDVISEQFNLLTDSLHNLEEAAKQTTDTLDSTFHTLAQSFPESAPLAYDGQYSDHSGEEAKMLARREDVTQEQAMRKAAAFLDCGEDALEPLGRSEGEIPCWRFAVNEANGSATIAVTVQGGEILRYLSDNTGTGAEDHEKAAEAGKAFLERLGYTGMEAVDSVSGNGVESLTFVPVQDDVLCLPDKITLKICPKTGRVCAYDASAYLKYHEERDLSAFASALDTRAAIPKTLSVEGQKNVILLSAGGMERPCVEYTCRTRDDASARICVNAETGRQERILLAGERDPSYN